MLQFHGLSFGCVPLTAILLGRGASPCLWHQFNNTVASACSSGLKAVTSSHCVSPWVPQHHLLVPLKEFHQNEPYFSSGCWLQLSTQDADTFLFFSFLLFPFLPLCPFLWHSDKPLPCLDKLIFHTVGKKNEGSYCIRAFLSPFFLIDM